MINFKIGSAKFAYICLSLVILFTLCGVIYSAHQEQKVQLASQISRMQSSTHAIEEQITQSLLTIENVILTLPKIFNTPLNGIPAADIEHALTRLQLGLPTVRSLSVLTPKGKIKASTNKSNLDKPILLDDFFPFSSNTLGAYEFRIGKIWKGRDFSDGNVSILKNGDGGINSHRFLPLAIKIKDDSVGTWILIAFNIDYISDKMDRHTGENNDQLTLIRFDGSPLINSNNFSLSANASWEKLLPEMQKQEIGALTGEWLTSYRASSLYPLILINQLECDVALAQWNRNFWTSVYWAVFILFIVLFTTRLLIKKIEVTERHEKQRQIELSDSRDKAEAATEAKSRFLANMSHEIRTPMTGVIGMMQLALEESLQPTAKHYILNAHTAAMSLLAILNDILDFSKIEAGKLKIDPVPVQLASLLADLVEMHQLIATEKKIFIELNIKSSVPNQIIIDPLRASQIINNLLNNAIKFTPHGTILLEASCSNNQRVLINIIDQGVGMNALQLGNIFQPFNQGDSSTTRIYGGTGLGLAICKNLCELMGGSIFATSSIGIGTKFTVELPYEITLDQPKEPTHTNLPSESKKNFSGKRLLLVEDHILNQKLFHALLTKFNIEVTIAQQGQEAINILYKSDKKFDIIMMDIQMPVMDGISATQKIRADHRFDKLPIVAVTANAMSDERQRCKEVGMQDYLLKPIDRHALLGCLDRWL